MSVILWWLWLSGAPYVCYNVFSHPSTLKYSTPSKYRVTFYCSCQRCTGWREPHRTASGRWPKEGRTVAADPRLHPLGSWVTIEGVGRRRVEDTGGAIRGERLDVYVESHEAARRAGVWQRRVEK